MGRLISKIQIEKILNSLLVGGCQILKCFRQITWFLENNRALSKFRYQILHYLLNITKSKKSQSAKIDFILTTRATLTSNFQK